jgi:hypothetical protein
LDLHVFGRQIISTKEEETYTVQTTTSAFTTGLEILTLLDLRAPVSPFFPFLPNLLNLRLELNLEETVTLIDFFNFVLPSTLDPILIEKVTRKAEQSCGFEAFQRIPHLTIQTAEGQAS